MLCRAMLRYAGSLIDALDCERRPCNVHFRGSNAEAVATLVLVLTVPLVWLQAILVS